MVTTIKAIAKISPVGAGVECRLCTADPLRRRKAVLCETPASPPSRHHPAQKQRGISLVITLVVLVIITLSSVAMMATLKSGTSASANIAFRQAATRTADVGVQNALQWFTGKAIATLEQDSSAATAYGGVRYFATGDGTGGCAKNDPGGVAYTTFSPDRYRFDDTIRGTDGQPCAVRDSNAPSGYSVFYVIHRMAAAAGSCANVGCMKPSGLSCATSTNQAGKAIDFDFESSPSTYYRITVKVVGPRQNNRYVQAFVC